MLEPMISPNSPSTRFFRANTMAVTSSGTDVPTVCRREHEVFVEEMVGRVHPLGVIVRSEVYPGQFRIIGRLYQDMTGQTGAAHRLAGLELEVVYEYLFVGPA